MSKKTLLNESQVRQFMKLASLTPLTQGFVEGLSNSSKLKELRTGRSGALGPRNGAHSAGHGRGQGEAPDGSLYEEEDPTELEGEIATDLGDDSLEGDEEAMGDEEEIGAELAPEPAADEGRMIAVDDFLAALESALETTMGDEVEIDSDEMSDEEAPAPAPEAEDDFAPEGEEVVADAEMEDEMMEEGTSEDCDDDDKKKKSAEASDDLVEQITKRVAARILKSALTKK
jgi:hypothetical protein|tara:strand:+ start:75 stop:764 length:690 start_codon:yes stop_codon:yes gene_type:complete